MYTQFVKSLQEDAKPETWERRLENAVNEHFPSRNLQNDDNNDNDDFLNLDDNDGENAGDLSPRSADWQEVLGGLGGKEEDDGDEG